MICTTDRTLSEQETVTAGTTEEAMVNIHDLEVSVTRNVIGQIHLHLCYLDHRAKNWTTPVDGTMERKAIIDVPICAITHRWWH